MTDSKHILIVDDEPSVATMISASLKKLGPSYVVEIAHSGDEAVDKLQNAAKAYALVITDYHMPGMNGLDLFQTVREISPQTQVVLMTGYGNDRLRNQVEQLNLDGFIDKPFSVAQIREIVERAVGQTKANAAAAQADDLEIDETVQACLNDLQTNTNAQCVLLISSTGYPISVVGVTRHFDVTTVSALVAANFLASAELANMLGSPNSIFKSAYHEGNDYNIYSYDINGQVLLAVIFGTESKPGVIWFYTKQAAGELEPLFENMPTRFTFQAEDDELGAALDIELDQLFMDEADGDSLSLLSLSDDTEQNQSAASTKKESKPLRPMSFEQAVEAGLVPPHLAKREDDE